jgi:dTDP-4-dehydrorhamnose reductase
MQKPVIIVSGKNGQLGTELQAAAEQFPQFEFQFSDRDSLDIANETALLQLFGHCKPAYFINAAAYTAVDKAETDQENAYKINAAACGYIANACKQYGTKLIHISTDYVFNGSATAPYKEDDKTDPVNYYGYTKWMGEQLALENNPLTMVIRTAWVYSEFGNNFVKTMLRLMKDRKDLNVVSDQRGTPTYAKDLAAVILQIAAACQANSNSFVPGIYNYSNEGEISWFEFATAIRDIKQLDCNVHPINAVQYPTPAKRPGYSVLDKTKIQQTYATPAINWRESLEACLAKL